MTIVGGWSVPGVDLPLGTRLRVEGGGAGVSVLHTGRPAPVEGPQGRPEALPAGSGDHIGRFTELVATAIANAEAQIALTASRARIITSADQTTGASSATCTTAPSNAWSPSPCSCAPPRRRRYHR